MEFLPIATRTRPRLAVELRPEGLVAARADAGPATVLNALARRDLPGAAVRPGLRAGNVHEPAPVSAALRAALDSVAGRGKERSRYLTLIVPDAAVRVLLLDFDDFPSKAAEALPVVRFRLKKLLPFDADAAVISYQVMSSTRGRVEVLAAAIPKDVLAEYEGLVTAAGFLPGAVLSSTLAALAGMDETGEPALVVNAGPEMVTTAIVRGGVLLLHRTVELAGDPVQAPYYGSTTVSQAVAAMLPLVDRAGTAAEWASQEPLPEYDRMDAAAEIQTGELRRENGALPSYENAVVAAVNRGTPVTAAREVAQAVSVAAAYFEDSLGAPPTTVWSAGVTGAERLREMLEDAGIEGLRVRELVDPAHLAPGVTTAGSGAVPHGWVAGLRGALHG